MTPPEAIDLAALRAQATDPDFSPTSGIVVPAFTVLALLDRLAAATEALRHIGWGKIPGECEVEDPSGYLTAYARKAFDRAIAGQQQRQEGTT